MTTASESFGQPVDSQCRSALFPTAKRYCLRCRALLRAPVEFHFLFRYLREDRKAVLNAQAFNLSVPQIGTKTDELAPRGR